MKNIKLWVLHLLISISMISCNKEFLDIKRESSLVVPQSIADFQGILDYGTPMNSGSCHILGMLGGDEYFVLDGHLKTTDAFQRNGYVWKKEVFEGANSDDWVRAYERILFANLSLEGVTKIKPMKEEYAAWANVKGSALFFRALNFYLLAQLFCKPYDIESADLDLGIPMRLESDINLKAIRGTVAQTYGRILQDLQEAADLLPDKPLVKKRPSRAATYALLAKTYLLMGDYKAAEEFSNRCLAIQSSLVDLKNLKDLGVNYPLASTPDNEIDELLFLTSTSNIAVLALARFNVATELLDSYTGGDLRREALFFSYNGKIVFGGGYTAGYNTGLGVNEVLLIRAECRVRRSDLAGALKDLNYLLKNRYDSSFESFSTMDADELLKRIIDERKKELVLRGVRWEDLRRLNKEPKFAKTLVRVVEGQRYELPPNDPRYVWPIPDQEILMSGIQQNIR